VNGYLARDWTDCEAQQNSSHVVSGPKDRFVREDNIFEAINVAKEEGRKIAIFKLGDCVIDWS